MPEELHWHPQALDTVELPTARWPLPASIGSAVVTGVTAQGRTWVGGPLGLYEARSDGGLTLQAAVGVSRLERLEQGGLLVDGDGGFQVFDDGALRPSQLEGALPAGARLLGARKGALWLSGPAGLVRLSGSGSATFDAAPGAIALHPGVVTIALGADGRVWGLREQGAQLEAAVLSDERELAAALPVDDAVLGVGPAGELFRRTESEGQAQWWRAVVEPDQTPDGAPAVSLVAADPETGAAWLETPSALYRLTGDRAQRVATAPPAGPGAAWVAADGTLWKVSGGDLWRIGAADPAGFARDVLPLYVQRCQVCHRTGDERRPALETAEQWRANIDRVLAAVSPEAGAPPRMPTGAAPLDAVERSTLTRWKEDGLRP